MTATQLDREERGAVPSSTGEREPHSHVRARLTLISASSETKYPAHENTRNTRRPSLLPVGSERPCINGDAACCAAGDASRYAVAARRPLAALAFDAPATVRRRTGTQRSKAVKQETHPGSDTRAQ